MFFWQRYSVLLEMAFFSHAGSVMFKVWLCLSRFTSVQKNNCKLCLNPDIHGHQRVNPFVIVTFPLSSPSDLEFLICVQSLLANVSMLTLANMLTFRPYITVDTCYM